MSSSDREKIFKLDTSRISNPLLRIGAGLSRPLVERTLCFPALNDVYFGAFDSGEPDASFEKRVLDAMNISWKVHAASENPIPAEGPIVVVANHPFGGIEGVLIFALIEAYRKDMKVMANYILSVIPEMRKDFFFVDPFGGPEAKRENMRSMKGCLKWLEEGHVLGVFPAGEVSSIDLHSGRVRDPAWSPTIARFVQKTHATVVPVYFTGHNGMLFNTAGLIHPRLRTLMLPRQMVNKRNRELGVEIGPAIPWKDMEGHKTPEELIQYMRLRTYVLAERETAQKPKHHVLSLKALRHAKKITQAPVVDAIAPELLADEIAALPAEDKLLESNGLEVYCTGADRIPNVLRELGRLRELTFRAVGEGTNNEIDLDSFDTYYRHLFIWNAAKREIVGAYRLGLADEIVPRLGVAGLYSHTCFKYGEELVDKLQPAIELGRSFVRVEYQRAFAPLLLLWRGICAFLCRNPRYTTIFGPVSISNDYLDASRNIMLRSLRFSNLSDLARLVKPRCRSRRVKKAEWNMPDFDKYLGDLELVSKIVQDIECDQRGIPILVRQYLKMGSKILAFNVDPAFNNSLDALAASDITKCDPKAIKRYMGAAEYEAYMAAPRTPWKSKK